MRILGEITHSRFKITLLEMNAKATLQIEDGLLSQSYRFREGSEVSNLNDAQRYCSEEFLAKVTEIFDQMNQNVKNTNSAFAEMDDFKFPKII